MVECRALSLRGGSVGTCVCVCVCLVSNPPHRLHTHHHYHHDVHTHGGDGEQSKRIPSVNKLTAPLSGYKFDLMLWSNVWFYFTFAGCLSYMKLYMYMYITLPKKVTNCCIPQVQYTLIIIIAANVPVLAKCQIFPTAVRWPDVKITFKNND